MKSLKPDHPAVTVGRTIFLKSVKPAADVKRLLQPASTNRKLGNGKNVITRGRWRGMPMYQLTLEERATCPKTCQQWANCYGNNMPFANRVDTSAGLSASFYSLLSAELSSLASRHTTGFVVRLHVLGDFFSTRYAKFWLAALKKHPELRVFGYTHRSPADATGRVIQRLNEAGAWIRWSDAGGEMSANVSGEGIPCPQQTGKTASCMTCGLCWQTTKAIKFTPH